MVDRSLMHSSTSSSASFLCSSSCSSFPFSSPLPFSFLLFYMSVFLIDPFSFPPLRSPFFPFRLLFFFCVCSSTRMTFVKFHVLVFFALCSITTPNNYFFVAFFGFFSRVLCLALDLLLVSSAWIQRDRAICIGIGSRTTETSK